MSTSDERRAGLICRHCGRPAVTSADQYDVFKQMHYTCFHYEFEHEGGSILRVPRCRWIADFRQLDQAQVGRCMAESQPLRRPAMLAP